MTMCLASCVVSAPSAPLTTTLPGAGDARPRPCSQSILFFLNRKATPLTLAATVSSLCFIMRGRSSLGCATTTPSARQPVRRLVEHLGGVQQRLRGDAADVEAGAAERLALLDHGDLHAELGGADGADIAAGAGADDDDIVSHSLALLVALCGRAQSARQPHEHHQQPDDGRSPRAPCAHRSTPEQIERQIDAAARSTHTVAPQPPVWLVAISARSTATNGTKFSM